MNSYLQLSRNPHNSYPELTQTHNVHDIHRIHTTGYFHPGGNLYTQRSSDMAHNNVEYIYMPNAGNLQAPAGQTYHLPPVPLRGYISSRRSNYRKIVDHKLSMGIPDDNHLYGEWWEAVKDQMLARGFRKICTFPDHHFQQIVAGMRTLRRACDSLVTAAAANNRAIMRQIDDAVVQLVKDCGVKLRTTVKNRSTGLAPLGQNGVFYNQIMLSDQLLSPNAPDQWGPATTVPNPGPVPQNVPPAYPPQAQNVPAHHGNYLPPAQGVAAQCVAASGVAAQGVRAQNVPDHHGNYPPRGQNIPPHPGIYPPAGQNIPGLPANYALPGQNAPALPADNALPNPLAHAPPLNYYAQNATNAPDAPAIYQMRTPDPSTEISTPSLVTSNARTPRVLPRGGNYAAPDPMPTG